MDHDDAAAAVDDDDMADLFSFGSGDFVVEDGPPGDGSAHNAAASASASSPVHPPVDLDGVLSAAPYRSSSDESFLDLLEESPELLSGPSALASGVTHDADTQEILAWLDEEKPTLVEAAPQDQDIGNNRSATEDEASAGTPTDTSTAAAVPTETIVPLPPVFTSLVEALASSHATVGQIRHLAAQHLDDITPTLRADLYCRLLTTGGKSLDALQRQSSLVDAFTSWQQQHDDDPERLAPPIRLQETCEQLADRVATSLAQTLAVSRDKEACRQDLIDVLQYHHRHEGEAAAKQPPQGEAGHEAVQEKKDDDNEHDVWLPPVVATLLGFSLPTAVTSVLLSQVMGQHMPVLALQPDERWDAAGALHQHLYWLACYHLPLLVFHLDRYWSGWCAPRIPQKSKPSPPADSSPTAQARHMETRGLVPPSWLVSFLSGGDDHNDDSSFLPVTWMGKIWDWILVSSPHSSSVVPFFLTLAVLERAADDLILCTGQALQKGVLRAFAFTEEDDWIYHWWPAAQALAASTPESVMSQLEKAMDESVQQAVLRRQERAEAELKARLEAERQAHQQAQEQKAEEARFRLNRARLVAFYRTHAPDKEGNIDQILENYGDRLLVLEAKLFKKYGESFHPVVKEKPKEKPTEKTTRGPNKLLASMNQQFGGRSNPNSENEESSSWQNMGPIAASKTEQVSVLVKAEEVLPVICWSKEAAAIRGANRRTRKIESSGVPLKFFLVDSRSDEAAAEQGRFPTSVSLSPETMLDPEKLQKTEEQFESLRGAVHIVILGSGFSAIPKLYNQKLSPEMEEAMKQDESRTNICALFFFKKGFPFVSILDGGFAAAHSWLVREGANHRLEAASVLVDYDAEKSLFGQMESLHNASATEKASRAMQNLMEKSLVAMTMQARQIERLASDMEQGKGRFGMGFLTNRTNANDENRGPRFANPFANKSNEDTVGDETSKGPRFGSMFSRPKSSTDVDAPPRTVERTQSGEGHAGSTPTPPVDSPKQSDSTAGQDESTVTAKASHSEAATGGESTQHETSEVSVSGNPSSAEAKPALSNPFRGIGTVLNNSVGRNAESMASGSADVTPTGDESKAASSEEAKRGRFSGFAAKFNSEVKTGAARDGGKPAPQVMQNMLKRNPFRGLAGAAKKASEESRKAGGFGGGLNSLRGLGRMRPGAKSDQTDAAGDESVTFE